MNTARGRRAEGETEPLRVLHGRGHPAPGAIHIELLARPNDFSVKEIEEMDSRGSPRLAPKPSVTRTPVQHGCIDAHR